jgi:hypothetical protein
VAHGPHLAKGALGCAWRKLTAGGVVLTPTVVLVSFSRTVVFGRWVVSLVRIRGVVISGVVAGPGTVTVMTVPGSRGTVPPRPSGACAPLD